MRASISIPRPALASTSAAVSAAALVLIGALLFSFGSSSGSSFGGLQSSGGCHGDNDPPHQPDARPDATFDAPVDAAPDAPVDAGVDGPVDAPVDGGVDASPNAPQLFALLSVYGGNQLRQTSRTTVVLTGVNLLGATSLTIAGVPATITGTTATRMSAYFDTPTGHALGTAPVMVTTPDGSATLVDGAEITPWVVAPSAGLGRGTFAFPMGLCDPALQQAPAGDTILFLGGSHGCSGSFVFNSGLTMLGAADGSTIISGQGFFEGFLLTGAAADTTTIRKLTFALPRSDSSVTFSNLQGQLVVEDVIDAGGFIVFAAQSTFTRHTAAGRAVSEAAIRIVSGQAQVSDAQIQGGAVGIGFSGSALTVRRTTVSGQDDAAVRLTGADASVDLGTAMSTGSNALSVTSGFALDDARTAPSMTSGTIRAVGTTLNGNSYTGQLITGPATLSPDYRISSANAAIQF